MPWQAQVADVALEVRSDGLPAYREIVLTVPRQCGKSTLLLAVMLHRALVYGKNQRIAYTAQTGWDARKKLIDDWAPQIESSPFKPVVKRVYRGAGMEAVIFQNGSRVEAMASTQTAGHGRTLNAGFIDEAFADVDDRREQAMVPAMATKADAQLWIVSTAGTDESAYLRRKMLLGKEHLETGNQTGLAYFEWSADPDDDPDDPAVWARTIPSLGHTVSVETVAAARRTMTDGDFRRSWLNQWTKTDERAIPLSAWEACLTDATPTDGLVFAVDISLDRTVTSIVVADKDGNVELIENGHGTQWATGKATELAQRHGGRVVLDGYGPAGLLADDLEKAGITVVKYATRDCCYAANAIYDAILAGTVRFRPHPKLDEAVASARKKPVGSSWLWSRSDPGADLTPLHASTLAYHAAKHRPETPRGRPVIL